jgi:hypothetical protein
MSIVYFRSIPRAELRKYWPKALPILQPALDRLGDRYTAKDICDRLADGRMQLWAAEFDDAVTTAAITQVITYPSCKAMNIFAVAGKGYGLWEDWIAEVCAWAKTTGCRYVEIQGREGWKKLLPGFRETGIILIKEI